MVDIKKRGSRFVLRIADADFNDEIREIELTLNQMFELRKRINIPEFGT